jgi:hypothetical protein
MRTTRQTMSGPRPGALATALLLVCLLGRSSSRALASSGTSHHGKDVVAARMLSAGASSTARVADDAAVFPEHGYGPDVHIGTADAAVYNLLALTTVADRPTRGPPQHLR